MFFQVVMQNVLRRLNKAIPMPPQPGEAPRHKDRTGLIFVLFIIGTAVALAIAAIA